MQGRTDLIRNAGDRKLRHVCSNVTDMCAGIQQKAQAACFGQLGERRDGVLLCKAVANLFHCVSDSLRISGRNILERLYLCIRQREIFPPSAKFFCAAGVQIVDTALRIPQGGHWIILHQRDCGGLRELAAGRQLFGHTAQQFNSRITVTVSDVLLGQFIAQRNRRRVMLGKHILVCRYGLSLPLCKYSIRAGFRLGVGQLVIDFGRGDKILLDGIWQV